MKSLTPLTIFFRSTSSSSSSLSLSPNFLSSTKHLFLFYSTTTTENLQRNKSSSTRGGGGEKETFQSFSSSSLSVEKEDLNRNVKISVWWDFENLGIPNGVNALKVAKNITTALRTNGIKGPVSITAFGDFIQITRNTQEVLSLSGINLHHIPNGGKNSADRSLLTDLVFWVSQNPPPAHVFLITGDKDFANILHRLRMNNYNILLACSDAAPGVLCNAASIMWRWSHLVKGENFSPTHFNEPPDGPWESWYGYNRGPLVDASSDMGQPLCVQAEDCTDTLTSSKPRAIPKVIVNRIRQVVNSYPKGIDISELRSELGRINVPMDKDFFGYKKFSLLLRSLPAVLKLQTARDGQIYVHGIHPKFAESVDNPKITGPTDQPKIAEPVDGPKIAVPLNQPKVAETGDMRKIARPLNQPKAAEVVDMPKIAGPLDQPKASELGDSKVRQFTDSEVNDKSRTVSEELNGGKNAVTTVVNDKSSAPASSPPEKGHSPDGPKENNVHLVEDHLSPLEQNDSIPEVGFFRRAWRAVFGHQSDVSNEKCNNSPEICSTNADSVEKREPEETPVSSSVSSSNLNETVLEEKTQINSDGKAESSPRVGVFSTLINWCRSGKTSKNPDNTSGDHDEVVNQMNDQTDNKELFSKEAFWEDMLSFLHSPRGALLISQSKTREQLALVLQKEGPPPHLSTLAMGDLTHLVDLLISEKKWVEECISKTCPFKLIHSARAPSSTSKAHSSKDLSSLFSGKSSQSNLKRPLDHEMSNRKTKDAQPGKGSDESKKKPCGKSNSEIIADCQKLMTDMLNGQPEGFSMSIIKPTFSERYGYDLDYQKLGYPKLATLLQTIPGVVIGFNFVLPSEKSPKVVPYNVKNDSTVTASTLDSELSDSTMKENDHDTLWRELGPISQTNSKKNSLSSVVEGMGQRSEETQHVDFDDNSYLSDDFSESDGESPIKDVIDEKMVRKNGEGESSLLQILDEWYTKDDKGNKDNLVDCSKINLKPSSSDIKVDNTPFVQNNERKKNRRTYSFISDTVEDKKGNLVNDILGSLKKSSDSKIQS
ncbi:hypothetical protein AQUCO_02300145v1 [Aquilegia coerulea]|uniref:HTH OST-type domain-containing protein n=1 Tax=Aquilegia coerulea TaxID=218851 RepID=A0A2G5DCE1_AQUCA|nr:hypothetical protein AQUCO_02300145v1 [Aquilegia coerulea]